MSEEQEIDDIGKAEQSRGRRTPAQMEAASERFELLKDARELLREDSPEAIKAFMRALGVEENSEAWGNALRVWRACRRGSR